MLEDVALRAVARQRLRKEAQRMDRETVVVRPFDVITLRREQQCYLGEKAAGLSRAIQSIDRDVQV